jgi:hypothetical protein
VFTACLKGEPVPMIRECSEPDCHVLTMGECCVEHELRREKERSLVEALTSMLTTAPEPSVPVEAAAAQDWRQGVPSAEAGGTSAE